MSIWKYKSIKNKQKTAQMFHKCYKKHSKIYYLLPDSIWWISQILMKWYIKQWNTGCKMPNIYTSR